MCSARRGGDATRYEGRGHDVKAMRQGEAKRGNNAMRDKVTMRGEATH